MPHPSPAVGDQSIAPLTGIPGNGVHDALLLARREETSLLEASMCCRMCHASRSSRSVPCNFVMMRVVVTQVATRISGSSAFTASAPHRGDEKVL